MTTFRIFSTLVIVLFTACKKDTITVTQPDTIQPKPNQISYVIKGITHSSNMISCNKIESAFDTLITMEEWNVNPGPSDSLIFGFTIKAKGEGTYLLNQNIIGLNYRLTLNIIPNDKWFYSKRGTVTIVHFDNINEYYEGTFSGMMYSSTNPLDTIEISDGYFYSKK